MPITRRLVHCSLIAAAVVSLSAQGANAGSVPTSALAFTANAAEAMGPIQVVDRWYGPYRSYSYYDRPRVYGWYSGATAAAGRTTRQSGRSASLWLVLRGIAEGGRLR